MGLFEYFGVIFIASPIIPAGTAVLLENAKELLKYMSVNSGKDVHSDLPNDSLRNLK